MKSVPAPDSPNDQPARSELDPGHIGAVCDRLEETMYLAGLRVTPRRRGYAVTAQTPMHARLVETEFARLGYRVTRPERIGRRNEVAITGWSPRGLRNRVAALRDVINDFRRSQEHTASAAIARGPNTGSALAALHDGLRRSAERHAGVITTPPTTPPADPDDAHLLHTATELEREVTARIRLHIDTAREAVHLAELYRELLPEPQAHQAAIHDAADLVEASPLREHPAEVTELDLAFGPQPPRPAPNTSAA